MLPTVAIPALVALIAKSALLAYSAKSPARNLTTRLFFALLVVLALQNLVEFVGFNLLHGEVTPAIEAIGFAYIALLIPAVALILHVSLRLSVDLRSRSESLPFEWLLYVPAGIVLCLLATGQLVSGFRLFEYSVLRVPGPLYFLFETYLVVYLLAALVNLGYGARRSRASVVRRTRNRLWLFALSPTGLLLVYLIVANHFGWTKITSTIYLPITLTFFLAVTTYATHEYRLFDIEFYIPWSKVRKRKTAFYKRIQATVAEIADLKSVKDILDMLANAIHCQVALIGGPRPLSALVPGQPTAGKEALLLADFPRDALRQVDHIVVANEIADSLPDLYGLMKRHKVGAIVPYNSHSATAAHWMLLGEHFSDHVYTPLDFKFVETLFDRIGERFLDNLLLLRSQLTEANEELHEYQRRLAVAWSDLEDARKKLAAVEQDNRGLRSERADLMRQSFRVIENGLPSAIESGEKTLEQYIAECERDIVRAALRDSGGNRTKAAKLLGVRPQTLHYLLQRHDLDPDEAG